MGIIATIVIYIVIPTGMWILLDWGAHRDDK